MFMDKWFSFKVSKVWLLKLIEYQEGKELKLAPKLTTAHINPTQYQKMNVKIASQVRKEDIFVKCY